MNANDAYKTRIATARDLIAQLTDLVNAHETAHATRPGDWTDASEMSSIVESITEVVSQYTVEEA